MSNRQTALMKVRQWKIPPEVAVLALDRKISRAPGANWYGTEHQPSEAPNSMNQWTPTWMRFLRDMTGRTKVPRN
jgi:hypothetical protein